VVGPIFGGFYITLPGISPFYNMCFGKKLAKVGVPPVKKEAVFFKKILFLGKIFAPGALKISPKSTKRVFPAKLGTYGRIGDSPSPFNGRVSPCPFWAFRSQR